MKSLFDDFLSPRQKKLMGAFFVVSQLVALSIAGFVCWVLWKLLEHFEIVGGM